MLTERRCWTIVDGKKKCPKCKQIKPLDLFAKCKSEKSGHAGWCKDCHNQWRKDNIIVIRERAANFRKIHRVDKILYLRQHHEDCYLAALKVLSDEPKCFRCGIDDERVLTIDHINNNGADERTHTPAEKLYRIIMRMTREEALKNYQILCRNCNWIKFLEYAKEVNPIVITA